MLSGTCYPPSQVGSQWLYCPSALAAVSFSVLYGVSTIVHCLQALIYRKPFALVGITGAIWETCGYVFRVLSVHDQLNPAYFDTQQLLLLLAPLWINAYIYMILGRMAHFYLIDDKIFGLKARYFTIVFVTLDLTAFGVQAAGATTAIITLTTAGHWAGICIYMAGVALQTFFVVLCLVVKIRFQILLRKQSQSFMSNNMQNGEMAAERPTDPRTAIWLSSAVYAALFFMILRNIYRAVEYSHGFISKITIHEWYTYVFDAAPMILTLVAFNISNPGRFLQGPRSDFSDEKKAREAAKKAKKIEKSNKRLELKRQRSEGRDVSRDV